MNNNRKTLVDQQRTAIELIQGGMKDQNGDTVFSPVGLANITAPSIIRQEIQFVNTRETYKFQFGSKAPQASASLNNVVLGDNDIFAAYGMQILLGYGADASDRSYVSAGLAPDDNSLYNGTAAIQYESNRSVVNVPMQSFKEDNLLNGMQNLSGFIYINPIRVTSGQLATYNVIVELPDISALTITPDLFISVIMHGALGQA